VPCVFLQATHTATFIFNGTNDEGQSVTAKAAGSERRQRVKEVSLDGGGRRAFYEDLRRRTLALHGSAQNIFEYAFEQGGDIVLTSLQNGRAVAPEAFALSELDVF